MNRPPYYPVFLDLAGKNCVVIGGGGVAERKVKTLLEYGARIKVISPNLSEELKKMAAKKEVKTEERQYGEGDLEGAFVVVAATDNNEVNTRVSREARKLGLLINVVDDAASSNFIVPSSLRRGDIIVAVSTSGVCPALARKLRTELEERFGEEYATLAKITGEVRRQFISSGKVISPEKWQQALDTDCLIDMIKSGREKEARTTLLSRLKQD